MTPEAALYGLIAQHVEAVMSRRLDYAAALPFIAARVDEALREMSVPARLPISPMDGGVFFVRDPVEEAEDMAPGRVLSVRF